MATEGEISPVEEALAIDLPCAKCRYNLRGLTPAGRCPECGETIAAAFARMHQLPNGPAIAIGLFAVAASFPIFLITAYLFFHGFVINVFVIAGCIAGEHLLRLWGIFHATAPSFLCASTRKALRVHARYLRVLTVIECITALTFAAWLASSKLIHVEIAGSPLLFVLMNFYVLSRAVGAIYLESTIDELMAFTDHSLPIGFSYKPAAFISVLPLAIIDIWLLTRYPINQFHAALAMGLLILNAMSILWCTIMLLWAAADLRMAK